MLETLMNVSIAEFALSTGTAVALGILTALLYRRGSSASKSFLVTLSMMPTLVGAVIALVNGNLGAGVAVAGAFSLVRFRSAPGSAKEIGYIFMATAVGIATGMGYALYAVLLFLVLAALSYALEKTKFGECAQNERQLRVTIPEDLDYSGLFDDLFEKYAKKAELTRVKTTNLGSLFELTYEITLRDRGIEKAFIDELRCRNGNLNITCGKMAAGEL
jgi:hypothetical protein